MSGRIPTFVIALGLVSTGAVAQEEKKDELDEVVVTGTHIRGADVISPVKIITREDLVETGYTSTEQVIRSLPQNFAGGASENSVLVLGADARNGQNLGGGSGVNLRGLGTDSTLVLVNGRRIAQSGSGTFVNIGAFPVAAIERVDVLTDGASAIYGADAVGGVVNIILRSDYEGAETKARFGATTEGGTEDKLFSQVLGKNWSTGGILATYSYRDRDALPSADRRYTASSDLRPLGGSDRGNAFANPGNITNFSQTYAIPAGQDGTDLDVPELLQGQVNRQNQRLDTDIFSSLAQHGAFLSAHQSITPSMEVFFDGVYVDTDTTWRQRAEPAQLSVPASNPFYVNPFGTGNVTVQYSFAEDFGPQVLQNDINLINASAGIRVRLAETWRAVAVASYGEEEGYRYLDAVRPAQLAAALADSNPATAFNPFGSGSNTAQATLDGILGWLKQDIRFDTKVADITADGALIDTAAGAIRLAVGAHFRTERLRSESERLGSAPAPVPTVRPTLDRKVTAAYVEALVPVLGGERTLGRIGELEISLAGRFEDYDDFGNTTSPKFGLSWRPTRSVLIRGTYGRSFRAPLLINLDESLSAISVVSVLDPQSPTGSSAVLVLSGNNPDLQEERAKAWTAGVEYRPSFVEGADVSLTYFDTTVTGRVASPDDLSSILIREGEFGSLVTRNPSSANVVALLSSPLFRGVPPNPATIGVIFDARLRNNARTVINGLDVGLGYRAPTRWGDFGVRLDTSHLLDYKRAVTSSSALVDIDGTVGQPVDFRARSTVSYARGGLSANVSVNYWNDYHDTVNNRPVDSWTTIDARVQYRFDEVESSPLSGVSVALSATNVFNEDPPFVNQTAGVGFDPLNASALGRWVNVDLAKEW